MFKRPVVIIVGAGASYDVYGLPLGGALAKQIASDTDFFWEHQSSQPARGSRELFQILFRKFANDREKLNHYVDAAQQLSSAISSTISIDDALYQLSEYPASVEMGKLCILRSILQAEGNSAITADPRTGRPAPGTGSEGWIEQIFSMAITGYKRSEIKEAFRPLTFVNFNYDRCIEYYFYWALQRIGLSEPEATRIVSELNIVRPYGTLGSILPSSKSYLQFGGAPSDFFSLTNRIRTFTESEVLHDRDQLSETLKKAALIAFIGFGFHPQNLELLTIPAWANSGSRPTTVLSTIRFIHAANRPTLTQAISSTVQLSFERIELFDMTAAELFKQLRPRMTLAW